jgi:glutamine synthetase
MAEEAPLLKFFTDHSNVLFLRAQYIDLWGILRVRIVTKQHALRLVAEKKWLVIGSAAALFPVSDGDLDKLPITGTTRLRPDWSSLRVCGYAEAHASVMYSFEIDPAETLRLAKICPRALLSTVLTEAKKEYKLEFLVGFEVEFTLLDANLDPYESIDPITGAWLMNGLRGGNLKAVEKVIRILQVAGIHVQTFHTEGEYQLEIATGPMEPIQAIDAFVYTQETIRNVFSEQGIRVILAPLATNVSPQNGAHVHLSMSSTKDATSFLAGMLEHLELVIPFSVANYDSFSRVKDYSFRMGQYVSWGTQHHNVPIRQVKTGHWEFRCVDATANIYLVLYLLLSTGLKSVAGRAHLEMGDLRGFTSDLQEEELLALGVTTPIPSTMKEALHLLETSTGLDDVIGQDLKNQFLKIKGIDLASFEKMDPEKRRRVFVSTF